MLFAGDRLETDRFLKSIVGQYYVYLLYRPDGRPFYVGKGINRRALEHESEALRGHLIGESNPFKCNVIRKIVRTGGAIHYAIDSYFDPAREIDCLKREAELIVQYRRLHEGGCLTNLAGGVGNASGAAPFSVERHAATLSGEPEDNPERATLNRYLLSIGPVESVPVKPRQQIKRILPTTPHPSSRQPKPRNAFALVASAAAHGVIIECGAKIPRRFIYEGVEAIIENGVSRDILKAGVANLIAAPNPEDEQFELDARQVVLLTQLVGKERLDAFGILPA